MRRLNLALLCGTVSLAIAAGCTGTQGLTSNDPGPSPSPSSKTETKTDPTPTPTPSTQPTESASLTGISAYMDGARILGTSRFGHAGIAVAGKVLYVLGGMGDEGALSSVERSAIGANASLGAFEAAAHSLTTARRGASAFVIGGHLHVLGGVDSVERAPVDANGNLTGAFAVVEGVTLKKGPSQFTWAPPRLGFASHVLKDKYLYVIGGSSDSAMEAESIVQRAAIDGQGNLSDFEIDTVTLKKARFAASSVLHGNHVYVIGGKNPQGGVLTVERAEVKADGTLGAFEELASQLTAMRAESVSVVVGNRLYVIGGVDANFNTVSSVESAEIKADGTLGAFQTVAGVALGEPIAGAHGVRIGNSLYMTGGRMRLADEAPVTMPDVLLGTIQVNP